MQQTRHRLDRFGLPISTRSATAADAYVDGLDRLFSQNIGAHDDLTKAIEADQGFALGHIAMAAAQQALGRVTEAKKGVGRARALVGGVSRRERQHVEAIATVIDGDLLRALGLIREHLAEFPRDALVVHQANTIYQFGGLQNRQQERFELLAGLASAYGDDWYFLSLFSFAHHELDLLEQSRRLSERSLELYARNANAAHNLGHVFYETSDHSGGVAFLEDWIAPYERQAPMHCHLSWHLTLFELASGHYDRAMAIYDGSISPRVATARNTLYDAASLLWRWQMYGCGGDPLPWREVCELADRMTARPGMAFADAHAALAYAAAGDETALSRLIDGLGERARSGHPLAGSVTLPLVHGIVAFAQGDYEQTIRLIEPVAGQIVRIGGSNAQREVFEETLIEAYLRSGRFDRAEALLHRRLQRRPSARDCFWLGRAESVSGATEAADEHVRAARERWQSADSGAPEQTALDALAASLSRA